ncbi:17763_t:CDS:2, partial [Rhizophagus irregularis]
LPFEQVHNECVRRLGEPSSPSTSQETSSTSSSKQPEHPSGELFSKPFFGGDFCGGSYVDREFLKLRDQNDFDSFEFNIEEIFPVLNQYCKDEIKEKMEKWIIDINFEDLKSMFDLNILVGGLKNVIGVEFESLIYSWFEIYIDDFDEYLLQKANAIMK